MLRVAKASHMSNFVITALRSLIIAEKEGHTFSVDFWSKLPFFGQKWKNDDFGGHFGPNIHLLNPKIRRHLIVRWKERTFFF